MTEVWPSVPPATRVATATEPGVEAREGAEGKPPTLSVSPGTIGFGVINGSSSSSNSDHSRTSSNSSSINDSGDLPALVERPAWDLEVSSELPTLYRGRTRSPSRGLTMNASCVDALVTYVMRTVEAKGTMEEEIEETERVDDSLLEEHLEKDREWLEELERRGALLEQREQKQGSDCPISMAIGQQPELSIPSSIRREPSKAE